MTEEEAVAKAKTKWWESATDEEIVGFQLNEPRLCMPFGEYHRATEVVLGRPVWTHEFANPDVLRAELAGEVKPSAHPIDSLAAMLGGTDRIIVVE